MSEKKNPTPTPLLHMKPRHIKMAARTGTRSILMILQNNRGL